MVPNCLARLSFNRSPYPTPEAIHLITASHAELPPRLAEKCQKMFYKILQKNCLLSSQRTKQAVILSHRILLSPEIPSTWIFVWHFSFLLSPFTQSHDTGFVSCLCFAAFLMRIPLRELVCNTFHFFPFWLNFATGK